MKSEIVIANKMIQKIKYSSCVINLTVVCTICTESINRHISPLSNSKLCQSLPVHPSSRRPLPLAWPSPGILATPTQSPTTSSSTEPKGRTASMRRWTASPPPATASGDCIPTPSMKSECQPSTASARGPPPRVWRLGRESRPRPALPEMSRLTLSLRTLWWSAGRSRRNPTDRWDEDRNGSLCVSKRSKYTFPYIFFYLLVFPFV